MSRISKAFEDGKAFITFITCGDPDLETTKKVVLEAIKNGADIVELGIPFSDPTAEGPVIQAANERALAGGVTTDKIFDMVCELREETDAPLLFMTYANVVYSYGTLSQPKCPSTSSWHRSGHGAGHSSGALSGQDLQGRTELNGTLGLSKCPSTSSGHRSGHGAGHRAGYGAGHSSGALSGQDLQGSTELNGTLSLSKRTVSGSEAFIKRCVETGIDGLILPDVPFEEKEEFDSVCRENGIDLISLIAPTSEDRITGIAAEASGFIYVVSSLGVTGVRSEITTDIDAMVRLVREACDVPCAVGFGISTPEQAKTMATKSDGAIVGSAVMKIIAEYGKEAPAKVGEFVKSMAEAVHSA